MKILKKVYVLKEPHNSFNVNVQHKMQYALC